MNLAAIALCAVAQGCVPAMPRFEDQRLEWTCTFLGGKVPSGGFVIVVDPEVTRSGETVGTFWQAMDSDADRPVERPRLKKKNRAFAPMNGAPDYHGVLKDYE